MLLQGRVGECSGSTCDKPLWPLGCLVYYMPSRTNPKQRPKVTSRGVPGIFLGYVPQAGGKISSAMYVADLEELNTINFRTAARRYDDKRLYIDETEKAQENPRRPSNTKRTRDGLPQTPSKELIENAFQT